MSQASAGVVLAPFEKRHLAETLRWTNDPELARLLDRPRRIDEDEHARWFDSLPSRSDTVFFAIEEDGRHVGNVWLAALDRRHRKAEVRIVLGSTAVNRGCGTRAIELIADHAFTAMGLNRVYAFVLAFNPRARRAFEKAQFVLEGTLREDRFNGGEFVDTFVLGRLNHTITG
jgi:RimJ/RimL family protein N-acetyltransferase